MDFTYHMLLSKFKLACHELGLTDPSLYRLRHGAVRDRGDQAPGPLGKGQQCAPVREANVVAGHRSKGLTNYGAGSGGAGARIAKAVARMEDGLIPRGLKGKFFIEVFSGTANLSFAIVHAGIRAFVFYVQDGDDGDISRAAVRRHIYRLLRHPQCAGIWFGMACGTFSRARRGGGTGPAALRGETRATGLYGMPGLSEKDAAKVALCQ